MLKPDLNTCVCGRNLDAKGARGLCTSCIVWVKAVKHYNTKVLRKHYAPTYEREKP